MIITAAHCIVGEPMTAFSYVFGYRMRDAATPELIINNSDIYQARAVIAWDLDHLASDWALIRLDRPVVGHRIAQIRETGTIRNSQAVHAIGYPFGLPAKFASGTVHSTTPVSHPTLAIPAHRSSTAPHTRSRALFSG